ncbi:MAG: hypothetical protein WCS30_00165 [Selenomonadaceae bacterium]
MKPILFNTEMVKAILDGRKTVTRRVLKEYVPDDAEFGYTFFTLKGSISARGNFINGYGEKIYKLPHKVGDVLYVRETFATTMCDIFYKADDTDYDGNWRPSIHMPKEAARIFLKVTAVRVEKLKEITEADVVAEGTKDGDKYIEVMGGDIAYYHIACFEMLWNSTLKEKQTGPLSPYRFCFNPWVWVIEFERTERESK